MNDANSKRKGKKKQTICLFKFINLKLPTRGSRVSVVWTSTIAMAIRAPCLTKSTTSDVSGSNNAIASADAVPAHEIPNADPYLT